MSKKVNDVLKGVAGAGIALGGAAAFGEADLLFAQDMEEQKNNAGSTEGNSASETYQEEITENDSDQSASESGTSAPTTSNTTTTKPKNSGDPYYYTGNFWGNDVYTVAKYLIYAALRWDADIFWDAWSALIAFYNATDNEDGKQDAEDWFEDNKQEIPVDH